MTTQQKRYIRFFCCGYLNTFYSSVANITGSNEDDYVKKKIHTMLEYKGLNKLNLGFLSFKAFWLSLEIIISVPLLIYQFIVILFKWLFVHHNKPQRKLFVVALSLDKNRLADMLKVMPSTAFTTLAVPFKTNKTDFDVIKVINGINLSDIFNSFVSAIATVFIVIKKYGNRDILFRAYSSFSYFLTCCFVENNKKTNRFIYYSTYNRWAFVFCQKDIDSIFIQHGVIFDRNYIRVGSATIAYYINEEQRKIFETQLFTSAPVFGGYRPHMEFTSNEKLLCNGKINLLIVGVNFYMDKQREIIKSLCNETNIYVKPHPRDTNIEDYNELAKKYGCVVLEKKDYPKVDVVLSYASTLADEYKLVGVRVLRYDLITDMNQIKSLVFCNSIDLDNQI